MPYREDKPLTDLIPPDRRRQKTIALVVAGMLMGAGVLYAIQQATKEPPLVTAPPDGPFSATLDGPDGKITLPFRNKTTVVHVWLQACADCMPVLVRRRRASDLGDAVERHGLRAGDVAGGPMLLGEHLEEARVEGGESFTGDRLDGLHASKMRFGASFIQR